MGGLFDYSISSLFCLLKSQVLCSKLGKIREDGGLFDYSISSLPCFVKSQLLFTKLGTNTKMTNIDHQAHWPLTFSAIGTSFMTYKQYIWGLNCLYRFWNFCIQLHSSGHCQWYCLHSFYSLFSSFCHCDIEYCHKPEVWIGTTSTNSTTMTTRLWRMETTLLSDPSVEATLMLDLRTECKPPSEMRLRDCNLYYPTFLSTMYPQLILGCSDHPSIFRISRKGK